MITFIESKRFLAKAAVNGALLWLVGCATAAIHYEGSQPQNLNIRLAKDSDPEVRYRMEIYRVDNKCNGDYQGTVRLIGEHVKTGIPVGESMLLDFHFAKVRWLHGTTTDTQVDAMLT